MGKYLKLIRVKHWVKNLLIFIPLICSGFITKSNIITCIVGFFSFCFASSFVYIINDIKDIEKDKLHPRKKNRPLASGKIKKDTAIGIAIIMLVLALIINVIITKNIINLSTIFLIAYIIVNIFYSLGLKNIAILDVALLASGFILRVYYGASLVNLEVSNWLFLTILSGSLFLGLGKRKKELLKNIESRKVLKEYNEAFLDKFQYLFLNLTLVFYSLWTMEQNNKYLNYMIPLLIIIFMRFCLNLEKKDEGDPTTILFEDKILLLLCVLYGISITIILVL